MAINEEQLDRLPKYAQDEIARLKANYLNLQARVEEMSEGNGRVRVTVNDYDGDLTLPEHAAIIFDLGKEVGSSFENEMRLKVDTDHKGRWFIEAYASRNVLISPYSSNIARIYNK